MARALGQLGGRARAARLPKADRTRIASEGGRARARSLLAARRIDDTLAYAAAADELRGRRVRVERLRAFDGPLPDLRRDPS